MASLLHRNKAAAKGAMYNFVSSLAISICFFRASPLVSPTAYIYIPRIYSVFLPVRLEQAK